MPSKRKIWVFIIIVAIVFALVLIYLNLTRIGNFALVRALSIVQNKLGTKINYTAIQGNILQNPSFHQVSITLPNGDSIFAQSVSIAYNPISLLSGKLRLNNIVVNQPEIYWHLRKTKSAKTTHSGVNFLPKPIIRSKLNLPLIPIATLLLTDGKFFLDSELRACNIQLAISLSQTREEVKTELKRLSFQLKKENFELKNAKGLFSFDGIELKIDTASFLTAKSQAVVKGRINFQKPEYEIQLGNLLLDLKELINQAGKLSAEGKIKVSQTGIKGRINLFTNDLIVNKISLPDFFTVLSFADGLVTYRLKTTATESIQVSGELNLFDFSYSGELNFQNLLLTNYLLSKIPKLRLDGVISYNGVKTDTIKWRMKSFMGGLASDSLIFDGNFSKNKLTLSKVKITKDNKDFILVGSLSKTSVNLNYIFHNFPLKLIEELFKLKLQGTVSGKGAITGKIDSLFLTTDLNIYQAHFKPIHFAQAQLHLTLPNLQKFLSNRNGIKENLIKNLSVNIDTLFFAQRPIGNLVFKLKDTSFNLLLSNSDLSLSAQGNIYLAKNHYECWVDAFSLTKAGETIKAKEPFSLTLTDRQFNLNDLQVPMAGGELNLDLSLPTTQGIKFFDSDQPQLKLELKDIDLGKLKRLAGYKHAINGLADLKLTTNGNYELNFSLTNFKYQEAGNNFDSLTSNLVLTKDQIQINKFNLTQKTLNSTITGALNYSWDGKTNKIKIGDLDLKVTLADPGVWILSFLKGILDVKSGSIYGTIGVKGKVANPIFSGRVVVNDASLVIVATNSAVEKVNAELLFDRNRIIISKISGKAEKGSVTASGFTEFQGLTTVKLLQYEINGFDLPIHPQKDIYAVVSGNLQILYEQNHPTSLQGTVTVKEALLTIGFGREVKTGTTANLLYNISEQGERGIWLRNANCDIELSIDLNLRKTLTETFYSGNLKTRQGNFYYLDHNLTITEGFIKFDNINELNPELNIQAEKYTRPMKINSATTERVKIILQLTGNLKQPVFNFTSDPPVLSQEDIMSYLTLNVTTQEISVAEQREIFNKLVSERFLGYFEREIAKKLRNYIKLDYLQFESGLLEGGKTAKVTVGKYIAKNIYATYTHNVSGSIQDVFRIEYYLTKSQELIGERDEKGRYRLKYQFQFRY